MSLLHGPGQLQSARLAHVSAHVQPRPCAAHSIQEESVEGGRLVMVPMRDGIRLAMRLFTPEGDGPWPALFQQRYGNDGSDPGSHADMAELAEAGFAVGLVMFRGAWQSEGEWNGYRHIGWGERMGDDEFADGYDTCEWLAAQPWCTGQVGTFGSSQGGFAQNFLAVGGRGTAIYCPCMAPSCIFHQLSRPYEPKRGV